MYMLLGAPIREAKAPRGRTPAVARRSEHAELLGRRSAALAQRCAASRGLVLLGHRPLVRSLHIAAHSAALQSDGTPPPFSQVLLQRPRAAGTVAQCRLQALQAHVALDCNPDPPALFRPKPLPRAPQLFSRALLSNNFSLGTLRSAKLFSIAAPSYYFRSGDFQTGALRGFFEERTWLLCALPQLGFLARRGTAAGYTAGFGWLSFLSALPHLGCWRMCCSGRCRCATIMLPRGITALLSSGRCRGLPCAGSTRGMSRCCCKPSDAAIRHFSSPPPYPPLVYSFMIGSRVADQTPPVWAAQRAPTSAPWLIYWAAIRGFAYVGATRLGRPAATKWLLELIRSQFRGANPARPLGPQVK